LIPGVLIGIALAHPVPHLPLILVSLWIGSVGAWCAHRDLITTLCLAVAYGVAAAGLGAHAAAQALAPSIRTVLEREVGGFALSNLGPGRPHVPLRVRARLEEDAVPSGPEEGGQAISVRVQVDTIWIRGVPHPAHGGVRLSVGGATAPGMASQWRAGRVIEAPASFRRPARYLNDGVPDFERDLALDGVALHAGVKSALLVEVVEHGDAWHEAAAHARAMVRARIRRWVAARDVVAGAIVTAILIGDRTGLPDEVRLRLQTAGTYHVIAISGGNIAILAALLAGLLLVTGLRARLATVTIIAALASYASIVNAGPSVWRATAMAIVYLAARAIDHRSPPWNAMAVSAGSVACVAPLDVRDAGFVLTFGATVAIIEAARLVRHDSQGTRVRSIVVSWVVASLAASCAAEVVLLPVGASVFSRVTFAGLILNLVAVPLMTMAQVAGLVIVAGGEVPWISNAAGAIAAWAAASLVDSARLVDVLPWLAVRVPAPSMFVVVMYYLALAAAMWAPGLLATRVRGMRVTGLATVLVCAVTILAGAAPRVRSRPSDGRVRLTMFDVGQGDALLIQTSGGRTLMVDTGGAGFDGTAVDIGGRVLAPALWARGVRQLDLLAISHADPDHIGGASAVLRDFLPVELWEGIPVPRHELRRRVLAQARDHRVPVLRQLSGVHLALDAVHVRVLHPPPADWERPRVRNDDSLVLEVRHGDVAMLLTGDIGEETERTIVPKLTPAGVRVLKVAHHGSRTSTGQALLEAWKPQIALISCGRGNRFDHPAADVMARLEEARVRVYRTDRDGQITVLSDGRAVEVMTYDSGRRRSPLAFTRRHSLSMSSSVSSVKALP
jgi:competence protein ComEC